MLAHLQICVYVNERARKHLYVCTGNQWASRSLSCSRRASFSSSKVEIFWFLTLTSCWRREKSGPVTRKTLIKYESSDCVKWLVARGLKNFTCVSIALCHRGALFATVPGREASLLRELLCSLITEPREPFTRWIRDLSRHDWTCTDTDIQHFKAFHGIHDLIFTAVNPWSFLWH